MALTPEEQAELDALLKANPGLVERSPIDSEAVQRNNPPLPPQAYQDTSLLETVSSYVPDVAELGGSIAGAIRGASKGRVMGVPGAVIGGITGAITGRTGGEAIDAIVTEDMDLEERITNVAIAGGMAVLGEAGGTLLSAGWRALKKARTADPLNPQEAADLNELFQALQKQGVTITPAQLTGSNFQATLEKIALSGFGGEKPMLDLYEAQGEALLKMFDEEIAILGRTGTGSREATGLAYQNVLEQAEKELIAWAEPKYKALDKVAGNQKLSIQGTQQWARNTLAKAASGRKEGAGLRISREKQVMLENILGNKQNLSFSDTFDTIKELADELKVLQAKADKNPELERFYTQAIARLHADAAKGAQKIGSDVYKEYKNLNTIYREGMRNLKPQALKTLATKAPEKVGETLWATGNVTDVKLAYRAIDEAVATAKRAGTTIPDAAKLKGDIQAGYLEQLFKQVRTSADGGEAMSALKLLENLKSDPKMRDTFAAVLPPEAQGRINKVLGWAAKLEKQSGGNFSLVVRGRQSAEFRKLAQLGGGLQVGGATAATGAAFLSAPVAIGAGLLAVLGPKFLATRATSGKVSKEAMKQLQGIQERYVADKLDPVRDLTALMGVMISMGITNDELPKEFQVPNLTAEEALELKELQLNNPRLF